MFGKKTLNSWKTSRLRKRQNDRYSNLSKTSRRLTKAHWTKIIRTTYSFQKRAKHCITNLRTKHFPFRLALVRRTCTQLFFTGTNAGPNLSKVHVLNPGWLTIFRQGDMQKILIAFGTNLKVMRTITSYLQTNKICTRAGFDVGDELFVVVVFEKIVIIEFVRSIQLTKWKLLCHCSSPVLSWMIHEARIMQKKR